MPNNLTFLDANILLEILLARKNDGVARGYIKSNAGTLAISALTAHQIVYFGQKTVSLTEIKQFLGDYFLLELTYIDFDWAFNNARNNDFEDALQLSIAIRNDCHNFITFDDDLYKTYKNLPTIKVILLK